MVSLCTALDQVKHNPFSVLHRSNIEQVCHRLKHPWRRGVLDPVRTVGLFLQQIAAGNCPLTEVPHFSDHAFTPSAYCQARQRLPLAVLHALGRQVHRRLQAAVGEQEQYLWHGHRVFLVDGSTFSMPDTPALQKHFGQPRNQKQGCGFPIAHLLALFHGGAGTLAEPVISPLYTSDQRHLPLVHRQMSRGDVLAGDDSFASWGHFALLLRSGLHAVMPNQSHRIVDFHARRPHATPQQQAGVKGLPRSRWIGSLGSKDQLVEWFKPTSCPAWISREEYDRLPKSIVVREIQRTIRRKGQKPLVVTVVTTLLDPQQYPADEVVQLRLERWPVETNLRHLKTTMKMEVLHCKTVAGVQKEVAVFGLVYNLVRAVMLEAAQRQQVKVQRISFAATLQWLRHVEADDPLPPLAVVPERPGRVEPRAIKRRPRQYDYLSRPRELLREILRKGQPKRKGRRKRRKRR